MTYVVYYPVGESFYGGRPRRNGYIATVLLELLQEGQDVSERITELNSQTKGWSFTALTDGSSAVSNPKE